MYLYLFIYVFLFTYKIVKINQYSNTSVHAIICKLYLNKIIRQSNNINNEVHILRTFWK